MVVTPEPAKSLYDRLLPSRKVNHYGKGHQTVCLGAGEGNSAFRDRHTHLLIFMYHLWSRKSLAEPEVLVRSARCQRRFVALFYLDRLLQRYGSAREFLIGARSGKVVCVNDLSLFARTQLFLEGIRLLLPFT